MSNPNTPKGGDFAHWIDEKSQALKFEPGEKFPVPPAALHSPLRHAEAGEQKLEEVLPEHEEPTQEFPEALAAPEQAPPVSCAGVAWLLAVSLTLPIDGTWH